MKQRPFRRALAWLIFLILFFFATYNSANFVASQRANVPVLMFAWERHIPFLAWTILPYWSTDLLYGLSVLLCLTRKELDLHGKRLVAIQVFSVACFLAFPLSCSFERPAISGWESDLFSALLTFDRPFNQAPSLHVGLAVVLWTRYRRHTSGALRIMLGAWFLLIGVSALTTYQHHFIDVPTGLWAGLLVIAALPERRIAQPQVRLTLLYLAGAIACTAAAFVLRGYGWLLLWPGLALSMVAAAYWTGDPVWLANKIAILPYSVAAWINSRLWTRGETGKNHLIDGVWIGRAPSKSDRDGLNSVLALCTEMPIRSDAQVSMLDLVPPTDEQLDAAVIAIHELTRPTLVCCALGYSRSAIASAAWLIAAGHAASAEDAFAQVARARPQVAIGQEHKLRLQQWVDRRNGNAR